MKPIHTKRRTIGLLGGSFNPAHEGHLHLTQEALKRFKLDEVWWLVSPQNPLKPRNVMAPYEKRFASAQKMAAGHSKIEVSDIEQTLGTRYSLDTVSEIQRRFPGTQFVWLMGADNLSVFHRWRGWQALAHKIPIIVFDRAPYSHQAIRSKASLAMRRFLLKNNIIKGEWQTPSLRVIYMKRHPESSTALRKSLEKSAF